MGKDNDEAAGGFGNVFRDRLTYLMNGNNVYGKPVNTQELADEIDISRPAVRKYLKPNSGREPHRTVFPHDAELPARL